MWIYYYAIFGPGHQSEDYGFKCFSDNYKTEDIKEHLFDVIENHGYDMVLEFWEVERPSAKYVEDEIEDTKDRIKSLRKYLKTMQSASCFVPDEKDGEDPVLIRNLSGCIMSDLLRRLHKAGLMYCAKDIGNWRYGKQQLCEPKRSKVLSIMRKTRKYPSIKKQLERK